MPALALLPDASTVLTIALTRLVHENRSLNDLELATEVRDGAFASQLVQGNRHRVTRAANELRQRLVRDLERLPSGLVSGNQEPPGEALPMRMDAITGRRDHDFREAAPGVREQHAAEAIRLRAYPTQAIGRDPVADALRKDDDPIAGVGGAKEAIQADDPVGADHVHGHLMARRHLTDNRQDSRVREIRRQHRIAGAQNRVADRQPRLMGTGQQRGAVTIGRLSQKLIGGVGSRGG